MFIENIVFSAMLCFPSDRNYPSLDDDGLVMLEPKLLITVFSGLVSHGFVLAIRFDVLRQA